MTITYKQALTDAMTTLAKNPKVVFLGYNVGHGSKAGGTLVGVPQDQLIEMPLAENLMMGVAIGMALEGYIPVVYFERFDFITNALDQIVNHLDKIAGLSDVEFKPCCIIRAVVGNTKKPLFTGITHTQDFTEAIRKMVGFPVKELSGVGRACTINSYYESSLVCAASGDSSSLIVEYKDLYDQQLEFGEKLKAPFST